MLDNVTFLERIGMGMAAITQLPYIQYQYNVRTLVYEYHKVKLYHYQPKIIKHHPIPLLVVFATVNRPEILDLFPEHSFIGGLLENGMDVYLLDWGYPSYQDQHLSFNDYVTRDLYHCVDFIRQMHRASNINLLGICQGGLICLSYAILFPHIKNLVLISTPIDFHTHDNTIAKIFNKLDIDTFVSLVGNIPGAWLTEFFISLRPFELIGKKYLRFIDQITDETWRENFLRVEKWLYDAPDQTGVSFKELIQDLYTQNKLIKDEWFLDNKKISLSKLTIPIFNVMASEDEIIPVSASRSLKKYVGTRDYKEQIFPSGHIGIYVSDKVGKRMPKAIANWLKRR